MTRVYSVLLTFEIGASIMSLKHESDSLNTGYCEYLTKVPASVKVIVARIAIIAASLFFIFAMLVFTIKTIPVVSFMAFAAITFMAWFVYQFTKIEYEYCIATGVLTLSKIYGARVRKDIIEINVSDISLITPESKLSDTKADSVFYTCRKIDVNPLCLVYTNKHSNNNVLVISAPDKTISCLKFYRRSAFSGI